TAWRGPVLVWDVPTGTTGVIVSGPETAGGHVWWQIETAQGVGYTTEAKLKEGARFASGDAISTTGKINLLETAWRGPVLVWDVPAGTPGVILDGPEAAGGHLWWRIQTPYGVGYTTEARLTNNQRYSPG